MSAEQRSPERRHPPNTPARSPAKTESRAHTRTKESDQHRRVIRRPPRSTQPIRLREPLQDPSAPPRPTPSTPDDPQAATPSTTAASTATAHADNQRILEPSRKSLKPARRLDFPTASRRCSIAQLRAGGPSVGEMKEAPRLLADSGRLGLYPGHVRRRDLVRDLLAAVRPYRYAPDHHRWGAAGRRRPLLALAHPRPRLRPTDLLPGLMIMSFGLGAVFVGVTTAANAGVPADKAGLAAALVNASMWIGGALGIAVFSPLSTSRADISVLTHASQHEALVAGFHRALLAGGPPRRRADRRTRNQHSRRTSPEPVPRAGRDTRDRLHASSRHERVRRATGSGQAARAPPPGRREDNDRRWSARSTGCRTPTSVSPPRGV